MERTANERPLMKVPMDRMLESAVILSWEDLPHDFEPGLIHIEYSLEVSLDYVKIWQLIAKGTWSLICEYRVSPQSAAAPTRLTFSNGYHSEGLAQMLEVIMQHQAEFVPSQGRGAGLVQVARPSEEEKQAAKTCMKHAYNHLGLTFEHIPGGAVA
jgi:hypothetical protein